MHSWDIQSFLISPNIYNISERQFLVYINNKISDTWSIELIRIVWTSTIDMPVQLKPTRQVSINFDSRSGWWWVKSLEIWSHPFECWVYHLEIQQSQLVRQRTQRGNGDLEIFVLAQLPLWYASLLLLHHTYKTAAHQRTLVNRTPKCWYMVDNWWSLFEPKIFE